MMRYHLLRVTRACQQDCVFCNVNWQGNPEYLDGMEEIMRTVDQASSRVDGFIITGGEPTLMKQLGAVVRHIQSREKFAELQTNAVRLSDEAEARKIARMGFENILVSLPSHDARVSDLMTRAPGSFEQTCRGIDHLIRLNQPVAINCVISKLNARQLMDFVKFFQHRFPNQELCFSMIQPQGRARRHASELVVKITEMLPYFHEALNFCVTQGLKFCITESGIPVCFVSEYARYHQEYQKMIAGVRDPLMNVSRANKVRAPQCKYCRYEAQCAGVWEGYRDLFGFDEIVPVRSDLPSVSLDRPRDSGVIFDSQRLDICMGYACNNDCVFCVDSSERQKGDQKIRRFVDAGGVEKILEENRGAPHVLFTTGEPTLNEKLGDYARQARSGGTQRLAIVTNGRRLADARYCLSLIESGILDFTVSVHAHQADVHDALTRRPGSFAQTCAGLENLSRFKKRLPVKIAVSHVVNQRNYQLLGDFLQWLDRFLLDQFVLNVVQPRGEYMERDFASLMPRYRDVARVLEEIFDGREKDEASSTRRYSITILDLPLCVSPRLSGMMGLCHNRRVANQRTHGRRWSIGRWKVKQPACAQCLYTDMCDGVFEMYTRHYGWDEFSPIHEDIEPGRPEATLRQRKTDD